MEFLSTLIGSQTASKFFLSFARLSLLVFKNEKAGFFLRSFCRNPSRIQCFLHGIAFAFEPNVGPMTKHRFRQE